MPDTVAIIDMTHTVAITIIHMVIMVLRMGIKATAIVVDGNTIDGHGEMKWRGVRGMVAYEFYSRDEINGCHLIGILPERRKHQERITEESIMKWVRMVLGDNADLNNICFVKVILDETEKAENTRKD